MNLRDIAHARTGDKGDTSIIMVAPFQESDADQVDAALAIERIAEHFGVREADVTVHRHPRLAAFTVVLRNRLYGGVTRSPSIDPHGKTLSGHLLDLPLNPGGAGTPTAPPTHHQTKESS